MKSKSGRTIRHSICLALDCGRVCRYVFAGNAADILKSAKKVSVQNKTRLYIWALIKSMLRIVFSVLQNPFPVV